METVDFITLESRDDLIVSFAIGGEYPGDVISLTLLRMPKYEFCLGPDERGVKISRDDLPESEEDMLAAIRWEGTKVSLLTTEGRRYELDVHHVDGDEVREAKRILRKMNADPAFRLEIVERPGGHGS
jgi:hypothetical protein